MSLLFSKCCCYLLGEREQAHLVVRQERISICIIAERLSARQLILRRISQIVYIYLSYVRTYVSRARLGMRATRKHTQHVLYVTHNEACGELQRARRLARIMEDEDLEETNNADCGQRARRLATLKKRRQREKDKIESRPYSTCVSLYTSYDIIFTVYIPCCAAP